jgi:hypothetical protein
MRTTIALLIVGVVALEGYHLWLNRGLEPIQGVELRNYSYEDSLSITAMMLGVDVLDLSALIAFESAHKPDTVNKYSGATGLIQFMPSTAKTLGYSIAQVRKMSKLTQLQLVYKYLAPKMPIGDKLDLYWCIFYPAARGQADGYVLGSTVSEARVRQIAFQNPVFDIDKDGQIKKIEVEQVIRKR